MTKNRILSELTLLVLLAGYVWTGSVGLLAAAILLTGAAVLALVLTSYRARTITVRYGMENIHVAGKPVRLHIYLKDRGILPWGRLIIPVSCENILFGTKENRQLVLTSDGAHRQEYAFDFDNSNCGVIRMEIREGRCIDPLGLFAFKIDTADLREFVIFPEEIALHAVPASRPRAVFSDELFDQSRRGNDVTDIFGLREYQPGDAINSIHWKVTEKMDQLIIKEFSQPSRYHILVLADMRRAAEDSGISDEVMNMVLSAAVGISRSLLEQDTGHVLGVLNQGILEQEEIDSGEQEISFLEKVLAIPIAQKGDILNDAFQTGLWRQFTKIVIVTPYTYETAGAGLIHASDVSLVIPREKGVNQYENTGSCTLAMYSLESLRSNSCTCEL